MTDDLYAIRARIAQLREYVQHRRGCELRKPKVYEAGFHLVEGDDGECHSVGTRTQISGPGDVCTCGLAALLTATGEAQ